MGVGYTPEQFEIAMRMIFPEGGYDKELAHGAAEDLMCEILESLGYGGGVHVFMDAIKWYS